VLNIVFSGGRTQRIEGVPIHPDDPAFNAIPATPLSVSDASPLEGGGIPGAAEEQDYEAAFDEDV
jgi:hypothetical protein